MDERPDADPTPAPTVATLVSGVVMLVALLWLGGQSRGIAPVELSVWIGALVGWVVWWTVQRRRST